MSDEKTAGKDSGTAKRKKRLTVAGVVIAVIVVAGIGGYAWHETPSFCGTVCHDSMSSFVDTYESEAGTATVDKWGNEVTDASAMLSSVHADAGVGCVGCHVPSIGQQVTEGMMSLSGDYYYPLEERSLSELMANSGREGSGDDLCLNESCHNMTREDLTEATSDMAFNPHQWQHAQFECSDCHKSHRASVFMCTECHEEAEDSMPSGWVDYYEGAQIEESYAG